jgi:hypothetical protein
MGTKVNSNYEDLLTFTRASKGHALRPVSYGAELVTNGTFDTDVSGWTVNADGSISLSSNRLRITNVTGRGNAYTSFTTEVGKVYSVSLDVPASNNPATAFWLLVGTAPSNSSNFSIFNQPEGSHKYVFVASATTTYLTLYVSNSSTASYTEFDNVSVKEVTFDQPDGTLTLFEHPVNVPRVEWDSAGNRLGLLVEEARTNLVTYSEDFENASWLFYGSGLGTVTENQFTSPDGTSNASAISFNAGDSRFGSTQFTGLSSGTAYTGSIWIYATVSQNLELLLVEGASDFTRKVVAVSAGWTRFDLSKTLTGTSVYFELATEGNGTLTDASRLASSGDIYIYGAQLEAGSFPTSYIKTTGATATRSIDVQDIQLANFGYNHNKGTVLVEFSQDFDYGSTAFPRAFEIGEPSAQRVNVFVNENNGGLIAGANFNNVNQASLVLKTETDGRIDTTKVAYAFADDNFAASDDGETVVTDTSGTFSGGTPRTKLLIGTSGFCGHIKSIKYYPRRLTNAQLVQLTS